MPLGDDATRMRPASLKRAGFLVTVAVGALVFVSALEPPDLLVWINLFAFGGLEAVFLWPVVLGLYWKRANAAGALAAIVSGVVVFFVLSVGGIPLGGNTPHCSDAACVPRWPLPQAHTGERSRIRIF